MLYYSSLLYGLTRRFLCWPRLGLCMWLPPADGSAGVSLVGIAGRLGLSFHVAFLVQVLHIAVLGQHSEKANGSYGGLGFGTRTMSFFPHSICQCATNNVSPDAWVIKTNSTSP